MTSGSADMPEVLDLLLLMRNYRHMRHTIKWPANPWMISGPLAFSRAYLSRERASAWSRIILAIVDLSIIGKAATVPSLE